MKQYGYINSMGEMKSLQASYQGAGEFIGFNRNGHAFIHNGFETIKISKKEIGERLGFTPDQVSLLIKNRGKIDLVSQSVSTSSKGETEVKKVEKTGAISGKKLDNAGRREKSSTKNAKVQPREVDPSSEIEAKKLAGKQKIDEVSLDDDFNKLTLKKKVVFLKKRIEYLEENYVSKEQLKSVVAEILKER